MREYYRRAAEAERARRRASSNTGEYALDWDPPPKKSDQQSGAGEDAMSA